MGTFETKFVVPDLTTAAEVSADQFDVVLSNQRAGPRRGRRHRREGQAPDRRQPAGAGQSEAGPERDARLQKDQDMFVYLEAYQPDAADHPAAGRHRQLLSRQSEGLRDRAAAGHRRARRQDQGPADPLQRAARESCSPAATPARSACSIPRRRNSPSGRAPSSWCSRTGLRPVHYFSTHAKLNRATVSVS